MGAGVTGKPTETLSIHFGGGGNGKSKFFGAIASVVGPYAVEPHRSLIVATRHEQHETVVAELFRRRLAVMGETSGGARLDDASVKNLTGGDRLRARRMREDRWSFGPTHTLAMFSNHRPTITGADEGIWRRVRLVPWTVTIPEAERDEDLASKLAEEAEGILAWCVEGARRFLADGFDPPDSIRVATDDYRNEEDTVSQFFEEAGIIFESYGEAHGLSEVHELWCDDHGLSTRQHWARVTKALRQGGAEPARTKTNGRFWRGVSMR
jgi:putative DNA primase/helicase